MEAQIAKNGVVSEDFSKKVWKMFINSLTLRRN
jgi:hypothetical protein